MKKLMILVMLVSVYSQNIFAANYANKRVTEVQVGTEGCFYFHLEGVTVVDPPTLGLWFAVPLNAPGAKDILAVVLAARVAERPVTVDTTGVTVCGGYAQATYVTL